MDDAQEILLCSLESSGIALPSGVSSARDLSPDALVSICAQAVRLLDPSATSPPSLLPTTAADRLKVCSDVAAAVGSLGYRGDLSFRQFLYPSDEDSHKLLRFLVERLSESPEGRQNPGKKPIEDIPGGNEATSQNVRCKWEQGTNIAESAGEFMKSREKSQPGIHNGGGDNVYQGSDDDSARLWEKLGSLQKQILEMKNVLEDQQDQEKQLMEDVQNKASEIQVLEYELEIVKAVREMEFYNQHQTDVYIGEVHKRVEARQQNLLELQSEWCAFEKAFEGRRILLEQTLYVDKPEQLKFQLLKDLKLETNAILSEIHKRDEECSGLAVALENQPKLPPRISYIQRITEITKNSRKQDADIQRIIKDTRELQIESNSISERLNRIYAVVGETIFREAKADPTKRDPVRRNVYRLLTSIHDCFEQIADKILMTDRTRRESDDLEAKLARVASRSIDIDKLQADLDAIIRENQLLEQQLQHG